LSGLVAQGNAETGHAPQNAVNRSADAHMCLIQRRCHRAVFSLMLSLAALLALPAFGRELVALDLAHQPVPLLEAGEAWIDPTGSAPAARVAADTSIDWTPTRDGAIYRIDTHKALWFRFTLPPASDSERWYVEIPYPSLDKATLYVFGDDGEWAAQPSAGDTIAVADWPVPHRNPLLPVAVTPHEARAYLLRLENPHSFSAPLSFVTASYLSAREQRTSLVLGIYFGLAGLAAVLGALSAVTLRDAAYGLYALSVALMGLAQAAMTGIAGLNLWPALPWWHDRSSMVLPALALGTLIWFFSTVVSMRERSLRLYRLLIALAWLGPATALGILFVEPSLRLTLLIPYVVLATSGGLLAVTWAARRGDRYAVWLLAGSVPVAIGAMFPTARLAGLIPVNFWTMHGMQVGLAIELPVLLFMLMERSQQRREHQRRIHGMDRIDPATGLINAQVFDTRLARMVARCKRLKYQGALVLIDIVNIEQIRRQFGDADAEELPLRIAGRLLSAAREIDSVARLSDLRFGMLVEGPLTPEEAATIGPRLVARCLMPFRKKPIEWAAQVRVAQALVPVDHGNTNLVMERLAALLAAVPADSKRAVFSLRS
jgi:GGDEF domain-containing protein